MVDGLLALPPCLHPYGRPLRAQNPFGEVPDRSRDLQPGPFCKGRSIHRIVRHPAPRSLSRMFQLTEENSFLEGRNPLVHGPCLSKSAVPVRGRERQTHTRSPTEKIWKLFSWEHSPICEWRMEKFRRKFYHKPRLENAPKALTFPNQQCFW